MVSPIVPGSNIGGTIKLTGVAAFIADSNRIIKKYDEIAKAAQNTANIVNKSPVASGQAPRAGAGGGGIRARQGGIVGVRQNAGPFTAAAGLGGFGAGPIAAATAAVTGLAVAITALGTAVVKTGADFQQGIRAVQVFGGAGTAQIGALTETTLNLAAAWGVAPKAINEGALSLVKAGNSVEAVNNGLLENVVVLDKASQGEIDMAEGADLLTQLMSNFNPQLVKAAQNGERLAEFQAAVTKTTDTLVGAVQNSTVNFKEFGLQLKFVGPVSKLVGLTFEETAAALGVLNNAGIRGETAGTALRNAILRGVKPTKDAQQAMNDYGISLIKTNGEMATADEFISQLESSFGDEAVATGKITAAQRSQALARIFNTRQILAGVALAQQGSDAFQKLFEKEQQVSAKEIASGLQFGVNKQLEILAKQAEIVAIKGFLPLETTLTNLLVTINQFVLNSGIKDFAKSVGEALNSVISLQTPWTNTWLKMSAVVDTLVFQSLGNIISTVAKVVTGLLGISNAGESATGFFEKLGSILIPVAAALEVATEILAENADTIIAFGKEIGAGLSAAFDTAVVIVTNAVNAIIAAVQFLAPLVVQAVNLLIQHWSERLNDLVTVATAIGHAVITAFNFITETIVSNWDGITAFLTGVWNEILGIFQAALLSLTGGVGAGFQTIISLWNLLSEALSSIIGTQIAGILDGFIEGLQNIITGAIDLVRDLVRGFAAGFAQLVRIVATAVNAVLDALRKISKLGGGVFHIPGLEAIDAAFKVFDEISNRVNAAGGNISEAGANMIADMGAFAAGVSAGAKKFGNTVTKAVDDFGARVTAKVEATRASINEAFSKLQSSLNRPAPGAPATREPSAGPRVSGGQPAFPSPGGGGGRGGGAGGKEDVDQLAQRIFDALHGIIPAMTKDLAEFLAGIAKDFPQRLQPMLQALVDARGTIGQMVLLKTEMLATDIEIIGVEKRIASLQREQHMLELQAKAATIGFDKQLLELGFQKLQVERQMWPLEDAIREIDDQINVLQRENLVLKRQQLEIQLQELPLRQKIEDIDKRINELQKENFQLTAIRLRWEQLMLPIKQQIVDIDTQINRVGQRNFALERESLELTKQQLPIQRQIQLLEDQITDSVDKRQQLLAKRQELLAEKDVAGISHKLDDVTNQLETAWANFDVPTILKLEESKRLLDEQLKAAQGNLDKIKNGQEDAQRDADIANNAIEIQIAELEELLKPLQRRQEAIAFTQEVQQNLNDITKLGLEEQKAGLEALLIPMQDVLDAMTKQQETEDLRIKIAVNGLQKEKSALEDQLAPLEEKLKAIQREVDLENLRNEITVTHLEEEKRKLEDQLKPLENQRRAIERTTKEIDFQKAAAKIAFDERMLQIDEQLTQEEIHRASLEETRLKQAEVFLELTKHFLEALVASQAFTFDEAAEVQKRLDLWDSQNDKLLENVSTFLKLRDAADDATAAINNIPKDVHINVTIHETRTGGNSAGVPSIGAITSSSGATGALPGPDSSAPEFQHGGIVPGPFGKPMWVIAHAGERILPLTTVPHAVKSKEAAASTTNIVYNNITNFQVNPSYSQVQSPISIREDLRALVMAMR